MGGAWPWGHSLTAEEARHPRVLGNCLANPGARPIQTTGSPPLSPFLQNGQGSSQEGWIWSCLCLYQHKPRCAVAYLDPQSHCGVFFSVLWVFFFHNIKNMSVPFTQPLPSTHSSEKQVSLNGGKISMFRSCKRLRWEVLQAIKMARFHHFLHTNYHTLGASALPPFCPESMLHYLWHTPHTPEYTVRHSWEMVNTPAVPCCQWKPTKQWRHCSSWARL